MIIRAEQQKEFDEIHKLVKAAFQTAKMPPDNEEGFVLKLRASDGYIPEFALVAEDNGKLVGHIMLTKTYIQTVTENIEVLLLSPLAVLIEHRCKGIGSSLVTEAMTRAKAVGYKAVFLCGDPDYYNRFGFRSVSNYNIDYVMDIPSKYVLVCELQTGCLNDIKGTITIV